MFNSCEYIISAVSKKQYPNINHLNEYVFLGRSNVGKSSFINALTNQKMLARVSQKPGKTQTINFFLIDKQFFLVDVPGYGYASRSFETRKDFGKYIEDYLKDNQNLKTAFLLVDTKVGPTKDDILMYNYLKHFDHDIIIIGTKSDKVGKTTLINHKKQILEKLNIEENQLILTSSSTKYNIDKVRDLLK